MKAYSKLKLSAMKNKDFAEAVIDLASKEDANFYYVGATEMDELYALGKDPAKAILPCKSCVSFDAPKKDEEK